VEIDDARAAPGSAAAEAARAFAPEGAALRLARLGRGHIHDTFAVEIDGPKARPLVLQRLNTHVFPDPAAVMQNLVRIASHLLDWSRQQGLSHPERRALPPLRTRSGLLLHRDAEGGVWRALPLIERSRSVAFPESPAQAHAAARAFGAFAAALAELPGPPLAVVIPRFHDLPGRCLALREAARADRAGRAAEVRAELDAALRAAERLAEVAQAPLPRVPVHNDCKLDNLLFDAESGEALCVVDLDTCMEGTRLFDFGELARTASCPFAEDEIAQGGLRVEPALLEALARGYRAGAGAGLADAELRALPRAGALMALENAVRFLTDHLDGDRYFRTERADHNLLRCRAQLRRSELLDAARDVVSRALGV